MSNVKYISFLNEGCLSIYLNLVQSMLRCGINVSNIYAECLDDKSYNVLMDLGINVGKYEIQSVSDYQNHTFQSNTGFRSIVCNKWFIIKKYFDRLGEKECLCYLDTDIVILRNFESDLNKYKEDVLIQGFTHEESLCSGVMFFRFTDTSRKVIGYCTQKRDNDDQIIVNQYYDEIVHHGIGKLDLLKYTTAHSFYNFTTGQKQDCLLLHNCCLWGLDEKISKFKSEGLWYIGDDKC